ncbi:hypothetical protein ALC62_04570 [Cyphomyrmex costatus]|uniref:Uncharacterized protein n=1 Tax=Cyphomyrmex costatus TaxID=456900 RepID=A0A195CWP8_9HYME|nr:hypothetical protein ALC62_04570 [Cyphomyrmex costatus]
MARREKTRGRPFQRLRSNATVLKRDRYIGQAADVWEVMHINKEGRAGRCTGSEERGNAFVSGRLMVRDPRVSYDADSSLVNDYDNSTFDPLQPRRNISHHIVPHRTSSKTLVGGRETSYPTGGHPKINDLTNRLRLGKRKLPNFSFFFLLSLSLSLSLSLALF